MTVNVPRLMSDAECPQGGTHEVVPHPLSSTVSTLRCSKCGITYSEHREELRRRFIPTGASAEGRWKGQTYEWEFDGYEWAALLAPSGVADPLDDIPLRRVTVYYGPIHCVEDE